MSETWTSLLSGVVGAIVGGAASLAGTVLVNRMQLATNARMRMYDELLPKFQQDVEEFIRTAPDKGFRETSQDAAQRVDEALRALMRASTAAGGRERRYVAGMVPIWTFLQTSVPLAAGSLVEDYGARDTRVEVPRARHHLDETVRELSAYLEAKLG
jgi:hypothetical protein